MAGGPHRKRAALARGHNLLNELPCDSLLVSHLANVRYLTGFTGSSGCVLITARQRLFFTDFRYRLQAARQVRGYRLVVTGGAALEGAAAYAGSRRLKLGTLGYEGRHLRQAQFGALKKALRGVKLKDCGGAVERLRQVKDRGELAAVRRACGIADAALARLRRRRVTGSSELQVAWMLERSMREAGSGPLPFPIIVASGARSAMPHAVPTERIIRPGELVVVDMGASVGGYCSDITRTFATGPLPSKLEEVYRVVQEAQALAMAAARPGTACAEVDALARGHIAAAGYGPQFGHALGHGIGLEAHEGPVLASRSRDALAAGMTVTVEPGVYLEGRGGVRIEDTVLIGARRSVPLTTAPRELIFLR